MSFPRSPDYYSRGDAWLPEAWSVAEIPQDLPPISIGVLSYNRLPALRLTLDVLTHLQYPSKQIIVHVRRLRLTGANRWVCADRRRDVARRSTGAKHRLARRGGVGKVKRNKCEAKACEDEQTLDTHGGGPLGHC